MPSRRRYKKKRGKSRKRYKNTNIVRQPGLLANAQIVKMRYSEYVTLDAGINSVAQVSFLANDLVDPYVPLGGHQPLGFDQWMNFYHKFCVIGSKMTAYCDVYSTTQSNAVALLGKLSETQDNFTGDLNSVIERKNAKWKFLTARQGSRSAGTIQVYYSPKKFLGLNSIKDQGNLRGSANDPPTRKVYFTVGVAGINSSDDPAPPNLRIVVDYTVLLTERKDLGQS